MTDAERIAELESKLEEARKELQKDSVIFREGWDLSRDRGCLNRQSEIDSLLSRLGQPSPLPALREKVVAAARKVHENHCCQTPEKCSGIEDFGWELSPALAALDSAEKEELG